jgi:hypothetical protein
VGRNHRNTARQTRRQFVTAGVAASADVRQKIYRDNALRLLKLR